MQVNQLFICFTYMDILYTKILSLYFFIHQIHQSLRGPTIIPMCILYRTIILSCHCRRSSGIDNKTSLSQALYCTSVQVTLAQSWCQPTSSSPLINCGPTALSPQISLFSNPSMTGASLKIHHIQITLISFTLFIYFHWISASLLPSSPILLCHDEEWKIRSLTVNQ